MCRLHGSPVHYAIRTDIDSGQLARAVRTAVASVDSAVPLTEFHTQTALIDRLLRTERLLGFLSGAFGVMALTLAAVGLGVYSPTPSLAGRMKSEFAWRWARPRAT